MVWASRRGATSPYALSLARCCDTADTDTPSISARSHTHSSSMFSSRYRSLRRVEFPARFISSAASSMSGVPSRFCLIWAISFDDMLGASPFIGFLQQILRSLWHPGFTPISRVTRGDQGNRHRNQARRVPVQRRPLFAPQGRAPQATAIGNAIEQSRLYSVRRQKLGGRVTFSTKLSRS